MTTRSTYHVEPSGVLGWEITREGARRPAITKRTKAAAMAAARKLAQSTDAADVVVHNSAGAFQAKISFNRSGVRVKGKAFRPKAARKRTLSKQAPIGPETARLLRDLARLYIKPKQHQRG